MSGLETLRQRLEYRGGIAQGSRNVQGKLNSLRSVLKSGAYNCFTIAFQSEDEETSFQRCFKALINNEKLSNDYDQKMISIPYQDICISEPRVGKTTEGIVDTGVKPGLIFHCKDNDTYWIIYRQYKGEVAYFKGEIRQCTKQIEYNKKKQWVYYRGPEETTIPWGYKTGVGWSNPNYSSLIYVPRTQENLDYFHRFNTIKIDGNKWLVKAVDDNSGDGIIEVVIGEDFNNDIDENNEKRIEEQKLVSEKVQENKIESGEPCIDGELFIYPYDEKEYKIANAEGGTWKVNSSKVQILEQNGSTVKIRVLTGKSGEFSLNYVIEDNIVATLAVTIQPI